jgi:hypothetical protein
LSGPQVAGESRHQGRREGQMRGAGAGLSEEGAARDVGHDKRKKVEELFDR